jgi:hypothetical protein
MFKMVFKNNITKDEFYKIYPNFDWNYYKQYNDLANYITNEQDAIQHYWDHGNKENRRICKIITKKSLVTPIPSEHIFDNSPQCNVSTGLEQFKDRFMKKYNLKTYFSDIEPCIFFGLYTDEDLILLNNHNGIKYIVWGGEDININHEQCINTFKEVANVDNLIHISISTCIYNRLKCLNINSILIDFSLIDQNIFKPVPRSELGDKILIYNGHCRGREKIYGKVIYEQVVRKLYKCSFIFTNQLNVKNDEMPNIYKQCFIMLRLTSYDGNANSVQECESMNIPVIHNQSNYGLKWGSVDDIISIIQKYQHVHYFLKSNPST